MKRHKGMTWLALFFAFALVLAACSSGETGGEEGGGTEESSGQETEGNESTESSGSVEIFSWWTGAGEEAGLLALIDLFQEQHPEIEVVNAAVAGGAGTNAKAVLASRMQADDPPGTFQVHGGSELNDGWVAADKMEPLNDLFEAEGWMDKFPQDLIDLVSKDGNIYSVPVNIHRGNVIFYNTKVFEENGLEPPTTFDEFFAVAEELKKAGVTPLSLGDKEPWTATQILENVALGVLGPDKYNQLWSGELKFDSPEFREAVDIFNKMLTYINEDHAARNWQDAAQLVADGEAGMNIMGDWAKGYFTTDLELTANEDFGWIETPETDGEFMVITDTFGLPKNVENPDAVKQFLSFLGSVEAQDTFNPLKGSIPARIDADPSKYDEYGQETMEDFKDSVLTPSLAHGSAAPEGFLTQANQAVNVFVTQGDVDQLIQSLEDAASAHNMR